MAELKHLWEVDHPYYCADANWYRSEDHNRWSSWANFVDYTTFTTGDRDQNLLVRWDWISPRQPSVVSWSHTDPDVLKLYFIMQRKGFLASHDIAVTDEDEPAVRVFLEECAKTIGQLWAPLVVPQ